MSGQYLRSGRSTMDGYHIQSFLDRGNQEITRGMSFEDGFRCFKNKFDIIMLKVQMDTFMH